MSLAQRSVTSAAWNVGSNLARVAILFGRSVLLARWLPVETFGIYALASSIVVLTVVFADFGMGGAFLHRAPETGDESQAAANLFSLKLIFIALWAGLLITGAFLFTDGPTRTALVVLTLTTAGVQLAMTPRLILTRRVVHRRLALINLLTAVFSTAVALLLAWQGVTLWALLATDVVSMAITLLLLYVWRPVWRPRLDWRSPVIRYYLRFGSRNFLADVLLRALDRLDDLWTGVFLGKTALGYYSRAFTFATYPRMVLAMPINLVAGGTYAELKHDRRRLSQAFFRTNALMVRSGFLFAGVLALVAPEFIVLLLGAKWLPMLDAFRLMLVFTLLDPIKLTVGNLFVAVGRPEILIRTRLVQLGALVIGLFLLGPWLGIAGVALAVDAMVIIGMVILFWQARPYADFSVRRLFGAPGLALLAGLGVALLAVSLVASSSSDWITGLVKGITFSVVYAGILMLFEHQFLRSTIRPLLRYKGR